VGKELMSDDCWYRASYFMQAELEEFILAIVVEEQIICACHMILSTVVIRLEYIQGHTYMYGVE
jgi:hypothetical protein